MAKTAAPTRNSTINKMIMMGSSPTMFGATVSQSSPIRHQNTRVDLYVNLRHEQQLLTPTECRDRRAISQRSGMYLTLT
jgi:hypothetical protein